MEEQLSLPLSRDEVVERFPESAKTEIRSTLTKTLIIHFKAKAGMEARNDGPRQN